MATEFFRQVFVKSQISNFMKLCLLGGEFFRAYRRTDMTSRFSQFCDCS